MENVLSLDELKSKYRLLTSKIEPQISSEVGKLRLLESQLSESEKVLQSLGITDTSKEYLETKLASILQELTSLQSEVVS